MALLTRADASRTVVLILIRHVHLFAFEMTVHTLRQAERIGPTRLPA
jgi:oligoendopeptidase F